MVKQYNFGVKDGTAKLKPNVKSMLNKVCKRCGAPLPILSRAGQRICEKCKREERAKKRVFWNRL